MDKLQNFTIEDMTKFNPERLPKLLAHGVKRNAMIGVQPTYGFTYDVMTSYHQAVNDHEHYKSAVSSLKTYIAVKIELLDTQIKEVRSETDLTTQKLMLIDILESKNDIERLIKFNEVNDYGS